MLRTGFASRCITPSPGEEIPGLFERRVALGTHDDLFVHAAVVDDGKTCVAIAQVDAIKVSRELVTNARRAAQRLCGISPRNCMIAATHTHSGGPVFAGFLGSPSPAYEDFVTQQIAAAIAEASRARTKVLAGVQAAPAEGVAFNRRFYMRDGTQITHPGKGNPDILKPAGPADPTVTGVGFCDPKTFKPTGCIVNFACHATHMNGLLYSADYPRWIRDTLQAVHGPDFGVVFLNGACGDVTQVDNQSLRPQEFGPYWCERTGRVIGAAAMQALACTDYQRRASVDVATTSLQAAVRSSTAEQRREARALLAEKEVTAEDVETIYARELLEVEKMRRHEGKCSLEIMGLRIADALFWTVPGEFFQAMALEVRQASSFPHTCCVELANGYFGYICTKEAFSGGGYEIRSARSSYLEEDAGQMVVRKAKALAKRMHQRAEAELKRGTRQRTWPAYTDPSALDGIEQLDGK